MRKTMFGAVMSLFLAVFISSAGAQEYRIPLEGELVAKDAKGMVFIEDYKSEQDQVTVEVSGLQPNSVFTVWLAREDPQIRLQGLGVKDYSFKTDAGGNGRFIATVGEGELQRWDIIEIAHHPNGNPSDLQNSQIALKGDLDLYD